jgi:hypothetical protein
MGHNAVEYVGIRVPDVAVTFGFASPNDVAVSSERPMNAIPPASIARIYMPV